MKPVTSSKTKRPPFYPVFAWGIFVLAANFAGNMATASEDPPAFKRLEKCPVNMNEKLFGCDSFVPDWRKAEELDDAATEVFLKHYWPKYRASHDAGNQGGLPEGITSEQVAAGAVVFARDNIEATLPNYVPKAGEWAAPKLSSFAALGESEPFEVAVRTLGAAKTISVEASDLTGPGVISKLDVTNRLMLAWERTLKIRKTEKKCWEQMVLLKTPNNEWKFAPNYTQVYWVDVHVPLDAKPGKYTGKIVVKADGLPAGTVGIELEVLPFKLKSNNFHEGAFGTTFGTWTGGFSNYLESMSEMDSRYGFNIAGAFANKGNEIPFKGSMESLEVDEANPKFKKFDDTMKRLKKQGMGDVAFWNWGGSDHIEQFNAVLQGAGLPPISTEAGKKGFGYLLRAIKAAEKKYGWPEFVINPFDEALMNQDAVREIIKAMPYVESLSPESRVYMTEWHVGFTRLYQSEGESLSGHSRPGDQGKEYAALNGKNPVYNFAVIGSNKYEEESRTIQDGCGGEYWTYTGATVVGPAGRFASGFNTWVLKNECRLDWANYKGDFEGGWTFHYAMPYGDEFGKQKGPYKDIKVLCSCRQAVHREGIDDRKYIETLRYYATVKKSAADLKWLNEDLPPRCRKWIQNIQDVGGVDNVQTTLANQNGFQQLRSEIKDRIQALQDR